MRRKPRILPEFHVRAKRPRCGFIPSEDTEVETWTIWCHRSDGEEQDPRRATTADLRRVGFVKRKGKR